MKKTFILLPILMVHNAYSHSALEDRIFELEQQLSKINERNIISSFGAQRVNLGGYLNMTTTQTQSGNKSKAAVDEVEFGLMMSGELNDHLSYFTHIEFEQEKKEDNRNSPRRIYRNVDVQVEPEDLYLEYRHSNKLGVQMGAIITPFGISNIEHFDFLRWQNEKPMALRESNDDFVFADDHVNGFNFFGSFFSNNNTYSYNLYTGTNNLSHDQIMGGVRFQHRMSHSQGYFQYGLNYQTGSKFEIHQAYQSSAFDIRMKYKRFELRAEYFDSINESKGIYDTSLVTHANEINSFSYYIEPWYHLENNRHIIFGRLDYLKDRLGIEQTEIVEGSDNNIYYPVEVYEYTLGYNFLPWHFWRLSFGVSYHDFMGSSDSLDGETADYTTYEFGTVVSF